MKIARIELTQEAMDFLVEKVFGIHPDLHGTGVRVMDIVRDGHTGSFEIIVDGMSVRDQAEVPEYAPIPGKILSSEDIRDILQKIKTEGFTG